MNCPKCDKETDDHSKFCSNCGEKVEEKPMHVTVEDTIKTCSRVWYILGYMKGINKDDKKALEEFENHIKRKNTELWEWYQEVIEYWEKRDKEYDEKNKKTNGSKQASIPKTEKIKA